MNLKIGDLITSTATPPHQWFLKHQAVVIGLNPATVTHCTPTKTNEFGGGVITESLADFKAPGRKILKVESFGQHPQEFYLNRVELYKKRPFNLYSFNCEQYAGLVAKGVKYSPQWSEFITLLLAFFLFSVSLVNTKLSLNV